MTQYMSSRDAERLRRTLNANQARRRILASFHEQGDPLEENVDAFKIAVALAAIPHLIDKVEICPAIEDYDPRTGRCVLRWNLFILGTQRMYLGETIHDRIQDVVSAVRLGNVPPYKEGIVASHVTPIKVADFTARVLGGHERGYIDWDARDLPTYPMLPLGMSSITSAYSPGSSMYRLGYAS
jgi:hypothetical protein